MKRAMSCMLLAACLFCRAGAAAQSGSAGLTPDEINLQKLYDATPANGTISLSAGSWPLSPNGQAFSPARTDPSKSVLWLFRSTMDAGKGAPAGSRPLTVAVGDDDVTQSFWGGHVNFSRNIVSGTPGNTNVFISLDDFSRDYKPIHYDGSWVGEFADVPALQVNATTHAGSSGQLNGIEVLLRSAGDNAAVSEDQGLDVKVAKAGQNSTWAISTMTNDTTGLPPQAFASIAAEYDILANGPDDPASLYDPAKGNRIFMWLVGKRSPAPVWSAGRAYAAGQAVHAMSPAGAPAVYVVAKAGTAGAAPPAWPAAGEVDDGTVRWRYGEPYDVSFGRAIAIDAQPGAWFSTGLSSNAAYADAVIDLSTAKLLHESSAGIRLSPDMKLDFSANATAAGQNQHTLTYSSAAKGLVYAVANTGVLTILDNHTVEAAGHIADTGPQPNVSACGDRPALSGTASDRHGTVRPGAHAASCAITFKRPYATPPDCLLTGWSPVPPSIAAVSASRLVVRSAAAFTYLCEQ